MCYISQRLREAPEVQGDAHLLNSVLPAPPSAPSQMVFMPEMDISVQCQHSLSHFSQISTRWGPK